VKSSRRYLLISPCPGERRYARVTSNGAAPQLMSSALWRVVDDGSNKETPAIRQGASPPLPRLHIARHTECDGRLGSNKA